MTRKDYVKLATAFAASNPKGLWSDTQHQLRTDEQWLRDVLLVADVLEIDNPLFDREQFLRDATVLES